MTLEVIALMAMSTGVILLARSAADRTPQPPVQTALA